jgi:hypothetical protein
VTATTPQTRGLSLARLLALAGVEAVVRTPAHDVPFAEGDPPIGDGWADLRQAMEEYEDAPDPAIARMRGGLGLSWIDCWLVLMCAAVERYPEAAAAMSILTDESNTHLVTPIAFARLLQAARGVCIADGLAASLGGGRPGRRGLLECAETAGRPHTHQPIRLTLAEVAPLAAAAAEPVPTPSLGATDTPAFDAPLVRLGAGMIERSGVLSLRSPSARSVRQYAFDLAASLGLSPVLMPASEPRELPAVLRVRGELPIVDLTDTTITPAWRAALGDAQRLVDRLVVLVRENSPETGLACLSVPRLGWIEAERIWQAVAGDPPLAARLAVKFRVNTTEARAACRFADDAIAACPEAWSSRESAIAAHLLDEGARRMGRLVAHIRSSASLADLVVPRHLQQQLEDILDWQRHSPRVFGEMGVGRLSPLGRGLTCLFSGSPGTGKTFAAQCIANELGLNLYRIDLSQVVSKYIGETEKALATVFDEAEAGHGVLLFDEADALFGRRSEVKDAHDRYANIEVGYLLQRLEAFDGIAILATNLRSNLDPAFVRRMRFLLDFPMPDAAMRRQLWDQSLPAVRFRSDDVDLDLFTQRFRLSGGSIQNISLAAAHMAAATPEGRVRLSHLVRATYRELEKAGQTRDRAAFGALAEFLPQEVA